jgi:hypothetical protein
LRLRGFAAERVLTTLSPKRENDSTRVPFPGKAEVLQRTSEPGASWLLYCTLKSLPFIARPELPNGVGLADGN